MYLKEAYHLTRSFKVRDVSYNPFKINLFKIYEYKDKAYFYKDTNELSFLFFLKLEDFHLQFKKYNINENIDAYRLAHYKFNILSNDVFTSKGIISENQYLDALDIINSQEILTKKYLIQGDKYLGINGKYYIYLGQLLLTEALLSYDSFDRSNELLFDIFRNKIIQFNSVRIIEHLGKNSDDFVVDINGALFKDKAMAVDIQTKLDHIQFI